MKCSPKVVALNRRIVLQLISLLRPFNGRAVGINDFESEAGRAWSAFAPSLMVDQPVGFDCPFVKPQICGPWNKTGAITAPDVCDRLPGKAVYGGVGAKVSLCRMMNQQAGADILPRRGPIRTQTMGALMARVLGVLEPRRHYYSAPMDMYIITGPLYIRRRHWAEVLTGRPSNAADRQVDLL
jgi:hypothetical protein